MQSLPSVCRSCQLLPFCCDNSDAAALAMAACAIQQFQPEDLGSQIRLSHVCISPSPSKSIPEAMCSSPAGGAGLDTHCPSHRVELPCHTAHPFRDWHLQPWPLFSTKIPLGWVQDPRFLGTEVPPATISVWETIPWQSLQRMCSADRIQAVRDVPWVGLLTMSRISLLFFYIAQPQPRDSRGMQS